jgi:hypothetical protein
MRQAYRRGWWGGGSRGLPSSFMRHGDDRLVMETMRFTVPVEMYDTQAFCGYS